MKWYKLNESYGYADWAADQFDRGMDREDEIADITDNLDEDTVCERYLEYHEDIPEEEWIINLWDDMYNKGLIEFENYVYDGYKWLQEPDASVQIGEVGLWGSLKGLEGNPKWKVKIEQYIDEHPEYKLDVVDDRFVIIKNSSDVENI